MAIHTTDHTEDAGSTYPSLEARLAHLASPLPPTQAGDWLAEHPEEGQTFDEYLAADPVRRDRCLTTLYLCLVGDLDEPQRRVIDLTGQLLGLFFDAPVQVRRQVPLSDIPPSARRRHPQWGVKQILSTFILRDILEPDVPEDALAYLALTARDLWPGRAWNFVFGQANLRKRIGVWSIHRNGWPGKDEESLQLCLRRTLATATHETGHILTMKHCTAFLCLMNGINHQEERDSRPLHLCPVCLRKLLWNLQVQPMPFLKRLEAFFRSNGLDDEADWHARAAAALER